MTLERITAEHVAHEQGHRERYELAASLIKDGDRVLDVACGIGYGAHILATHAPRHTYRGVDRDGVDVRFLQYGWFTHANLDVWNPEEPFDVAITFETLEHLTNPQHLVDVVKQATRLVLVSVPTVPTKHFNEYHLHDFTVDDVLTMFADLDCVDVIAQPEELSHIFIFRKERA